MPFDAAVEFGAGQSGEDFGAGREAAGDGVEQEVDLLGKRGELGIVEADIDAPVEIAGTGRRDHRAERLLELGHHGATVGLAADLLGLLGLGQLEELEAVEPEDFGGTGHAADLVLAAHIGNGLGKVAPGHGGERGGGALETEGDAAQDDIAAVADGAQRDERGDDHPKPHIGLQDTLFLHVEGGHAHHVVDIGADGTADRVDGGIEALGGEGFEPCGVAAGEDLVQHGDFGVRELLGGDDGLDQGHLVVLEGARLEPRPGGVDVGAGGGENLAGLFPAHGAGTGLVHIVDDGHGIGIHRNLEIAHGRDVGRQKVGGLLVDDAQRHEAGADQGQDDGREHGQRDDEARFQRH